MDSFKILQNKLEAFIRRFYLNELIRGALLFFGIGLFYFIITLFIEYFLWLEPMGRQMLFWIFIVVECLLFVKFMIIPLLQLFRISKGINYEEASNIIGAHFPEVKDKLLNILQLKQKKQQSELLLAGIDQKARELRPVPFKFAINFKDNIPFLKYTAIPIGILVVIYFSGNSHIFSESYKRMVHYKIAYQPPAPFSFQLLNKNLVVREDEPFHLQIKTLGNVVPENASIHFNGQTYFLKEKSPGNFEYTFESVHENIRFYFSANEVISGNYTVEVVQVPRMLNFEMLLDFPAYTDINDEIKEGDGNATIPEGTKVQWRLKTKATSKVGIQLKDTLFNFKRQKDSFRFGKTFYNSSFYTITTSNQQIKDYEKLAYSLEVLKDQFPEIRLKRKKDSVELQTWYFQGEVSDDYGISEVRLVIYPESKPENKVFRNIPVSNGNFDQFFMAFPDTLSLQKGVEYAYYFEVFDNDALRNHKSTKSRIFSFRSKTDEAIKAEQLSRQEEAIKGLSESLETMKFTKEEFGDLKNIQRQKGELQYEDRKKFKSFLERQQRQNDFMKRYSEKLKKSLELVNPEKEDKIGKQLRERLERREERLEKNEKLLEELEKYASKISKEQLAAELEKLSKKSQNAQKNLEQLLELTKRYYVEEMTQKIARELEKLAVEQAALAKAGKENTQQRQESLNKKFDSIQRKTQALKDENQSLKEPMKLGLDKNAEKGIDAQQAEAGKKLGQGEKHKAAEHQKKAAEKMKSLSQQIQKKRAMAAGMQLQADAGMLRQILDNLLVFSFEQEELMEDFKTMGENNFVFADKLKRQNVLREHFEHVDDSLYALALRNPMLTEKVTEKLTNLKFDLDKAIERLAQNELRLGLSSQQYVVSGANDLAYFLSQVLNSMQNMMKPSGKGGKGSEVQLPDIIKKQKEINQKMKEGLEQKKDGSKKQSIQKRETLKGELYEIFKGQQMLRNTLKKKLEEEGVGSPGGALKESMKQIEKELLEKGFNQETLNRMLKLEHKLLDLKNAKQEQGKKNMRESTSNEKEFDNQAKNQILKAKEYFNSTEILNRQSLPLRQIYKRKVKEYFERGTY